MAQAVEATRKRLEAVSTTVIYWRDFITILTKNALCYVLKKLRSLFFLEKKRAIKRDGRANIGMWGAEVLCGQISSCVDTSLCNNFYLLSAVFVARTNKGGKFLKKLWCCVGGSKQDNLVLSTELTM